LNSTLALISGLDLCLGLETSGIGLGLEALGLGLEAFGLGLETPGLVNIPDCDYCDCDLWALLQPACSVCVSSERFFISVCAHRRRLWV